MRAGLVLLGLVLAAPLPAAPLLPPAGLPPAVREAIVLELQGRLNEALERYRLALTSDPQLSADEAMARPLTIVVLAKTAHLCLDLGQAEEAADLASRLLSAKNRRAAEAGALVRLRLLRLLGRPAEAQAFADQWTSTAPASPDLVAELVRLRGQEGGAGPWASALRLGSPADAVGLTMQEAVRIQVGAFRDWSRALTLVDQLRERGWTPQTDLKTGPTGETLHGVYVLSRQPASDRDRLEAEGLLAR